MDEGLTVILMPLSEKKGGEHILWQDLRAADY